VRENFFLLLGLMAKKQPNSAEVLKDIKEHLGAYTAAANTAKAARKRWTALKKKT
jgi:hypothetical protein